VKLVTDIDPVSVGTAEKVFMVIGQRSRSYSCVYKCVNATVVEAFISTVRRQGLLVSVTKFCYIAAMLF